jgi:hypothetical protein
MGQALFLELLFNLTKRFLGIVSQLIVNRGFEHSLKQRLAKFLPLHEPIERSAVDEAQIAVSPVTNAKPHRADALAQRARKWCPGFFVGRNDFVCRFEFGIACQPAAQNRLRPVLIRQIDKLVVEPSLHRRQRKFVALEDALIAYGKNSFDQEARRSDPVEVVEFGDADVRRGREQQRDRLQHRGLAGISGPDNEVEAGGRLPLKAFDTPEIFDPEGSNGRSGRSNRCIRHGANSLFGRIGVGQIECLTVDLFDPLRLQIC